MKAIILYMPTLHQGYLDFLKRYEETPNGKNSYATTIYLMNPLFVPEFALKKGREYLTRSFKSALKDFSIVFDAVEKQASKMNMKVYSLHPDDLKNMKPKNGSDLWLRLHVSDIILPKEDISNYLIEDYLEPLGLKNNIIIIDDKTFVRSNNLIPQNEVVIPDIVMSNIPSFLKEVAKIAYKEADRSSDWWRQVGAVLFNDKEEILLVGFNKHLPDEHIPNIYGCFRAFLNAGSDPDWGTALHAERMIFGKALKRGISTDGLSLYVTTYPCSGCAAMISQTGIKCIYYTEGYSMAQQAGDMLKAFGIEVIHIPKEVIEK